MNKIGLVNEKEEYDALFDLYDADHDGLLDYCAFSAAIFGLSYVQVKSPSTPNPDLPLSKAKAKIKNRGLRSAINIDKQFDLIDENHDGKLTYLEFSKAMKEQKLDLDDNELKVLFNYFDRNKDGSISNSEFLKSVKGAMNEYRKSLICKVFSRIDVANEGAVEFVDVLNLYNTAKLPAVLEGRKSEEQALNEFKETFEMHHLNFNHGKAEAGISLQEFIEYYNNVSFAIEDDEYFEYIVTNSWNLSKTTGPVKSTQKFNGESTESPFKSEKSRTQKAHFDKSQVKDNMPIPVEEQKVSAAKEHPSDESPKEPKTGLEARVKSGNIIVSNIPKYQSILLERLRNKVLMRGGKGLIGLHRQFCLFDSDSKQSLTFADFQQAIKDYKLIMDTKDVETLFKMFDKSQDGLISYEEFMSTLSGSMNEFRMNVVMKAYENLESSGKEVTLNLLKSRFSANKHPDVKNGKKTEEEVIKEFADTFEIFHSMYATNKEDEVVSEEEFMKYYNYISANIESDANFDIMMSNGWGLDYKSNLDKQPYAGAANKIYSVSSKSQWKNDHHRDFHDGPNAAEFSETTSMKSEKFHGELEDLIAEVRKKVTTRGIRGILTMISHFKKVSDKINLDMFANEMKVQRLTTSSQDNADLFRYFDSDKDGFISFVDFIKTLTGPLNQYRASLVEQAYKSLLKGSSAVSVEYAKSIYINRNVYSSEPP
jgi:Ca2+-binding EF-hand superfamily protein